eukprot:403345636
MDHFKPHQDSRQKQETLAKKLFASHGFFGQTPNLIKYQSYKEFKKQQSKPQLNFNSDQIKDILNHKSTLYDNPNAKPTVQPTKLDSSFQAHPTLLQAVDPSQIKTTLSPLRYPTLVPDLIENIDETKSACYNFKKFAKKRFNSVKAFTQDKRGEAIQTMKQAIQQSFIQKFLAKRLKDGDHSMKKYDPLDEKLLLRDQDFKFDLTNAEMERYREMQKEYLLSFKKVGAEIPPEKQKLYKILIEKDYSEHPIKEDAKKKGAGLLRNILQQKIQQRGEEEKEKELKKREETIKNAKRFKIENHSKNILNEDKTYLIEINKHLDQEIIFHFKPSLKPVKDRARKATALKPDSQESSVRHTKRYLSINSGIPSREKHDRKAHSQAMLLPQGIFGTSKTVNNVTFEKLPYFNQVNDTDKKAFDSITNFISPKSPLKLESTINSSEKRAAFGKAQFLQISQTRNLFPNQISSPLLPSEGPLLQKHSLQIQPFEIDPLDQMKNDSKLYFNSLYKKVDISRKNPDVLLKRNHIDSQFSFYLQQLNDQTLKKKNNLDLDGRRTRNEVFLQYNRYLNPGTFSYKRLNTDEDVLLTHQAADVFKTSQSALNLQSEMQSQIQNLKSTLDKTTINMSQMASVERVEDFVGQQLLKHHMKTNFLLQITKNLKNKKLSLNRVKDDL